MVRVVVVIGSQGKIWGLIPTFLENMYVPLRGDYLFDEKKESLAGET